VCLARRECAEHLPPHYFSPAHRSARLAAHYEHQESLSGFGSQDPRTPGRIRAHTRWDRVHGLQPERPRKTRRPAGHDRPL